MGTASDLAIHHFLVGCSICVGCRLHVGDDGVIVTVYDKDLEFFDVASVWLDVCVASGTADHRF